MTQYDDDADLLGDDCEYCGAPNAWCICSAPCACCGKAMSHNHCYHCGHDPVETHVERERERIAERNEY